MAGRERHRAGLVLGWKIAFYSTNLFLKQPLKLNKAYECKPSEYYESFPGCPTDQPFLLAASERNLPARSERPVRGPAGRVRSRGFQNARRRVHTWPFGKVA